MFLVRRGVEALHENTIEGTGFPITVTDPGGFGKTRIYRVRVIY